MVCNPKAWAPAATSPGEFCPLQQIRKERMEETAEPPSDKGQTGGRKGRGKAEILCRLCTRAQGRAEERINQPFR